MRTYEYPDAKSVVVCGDIHGDFHFLVQKFCVQYRMTDTLLIVAGDCGFGFDKPAYYEQAYSKDAGRLRKANNWIAFVRGNHDNPAYFNEERIAYKRWRTIPDYSVISACGHDILCVGGSTFSDFGYGCHLLFVSRRKSKHRAAQQADLHAPMTRQRKAWPHHKRRSACPLFL